MEGFKISQLFDRTKNLGFKGTDMNMCCKDVQYSLNKTCIYTGEIKPCRRGFHFCEVLMDVDEYYPFNHNDNRFFLIQHGDNVLSKGIKCVSDEMTFLEEIKTDTLEDLKYLLEVSEYKKIYKENINGITYLSIYAKKTVESKIEMIEYLVSKGVDIETRGNILLRHASENGDLKTVEFLVSKGANIHVYNDSPLRFASENGHIEVVKFLINSGANISAYHEYPLRYACKNGYIEIVKLLVNLGADIHIDRESPLRGAIINGHIEVVKFLKESGADIHIDEETPLRSAIVNNYSEVIKFLLESGANINTNDCYNLYLAYKRHCGQEITDLLEKYL